MMIGALTGLLLFYREESNNPVTVLHAEFHIVLNESDRKV